MNVSIAVVVIAIVAVVAAGAYYITTSENDEEEVPEYITISGMIIYDDYSQGEIFIGAFDNSDLLKPPGETIDAVSLWAPGTYSLTIPANYGEIWIAAINDANNDGVLDIGGEPAGRYARNPLTVGTRDIEDVDITLQPGGLF
ncbi:MAG: hypothetical protein E3J91_02640 [Hadesarchaea archaeon]|nr:MAG: hypothetical protein E3J91_02640 [Hadesarchaea archaeon]